MTNKKVRTRFAPSPTGNLHVGGARTALFNYLLAKKSNGSFVLRIEDTDQKRNSNQYYLEQYNNLKWLNIFPDESPFDGGNFSPYKQTDRIAIYKQFLAIMLAKKNAYYCFCNKAEIEKERRDYIANEGRSNYKYSRKCLSLTRQEISSYLQSKRKYSIRFLVDRRRNYSFNDLVRGEISFNGEDIEDFIICRENGVPLLNFSVAIDDHLMEISHVLRAEEHLSNTAKQIAIYGSLEWTPPHFAHLSIILNQKRKKISKRDREFEFQTIKSLRELGYLPEAIVNYLVFLGWKNDSNEEFFNIQQLVNIFEISNFNSRSPVFSVEKLNWFNNYWIKNIQTTRFNDLAWSFLQRMFSLSEVQKQYSLKVSELFRQQLKNFSELPSLARFFFHYEAKEFFITGGLRSAIENFASKFLQSGNPDQIVVGQFLKETVVSSRIEKKDFFLNLRKILTGIEKGPELPRVIALLGKEEFKRRLEKHSFFFG